MNAKLSYPLTILQYLLYVCPDVLRQALELGFAEGHPGPALAAGGRPVLIHYHNLIHKGGKIEFTSQGNGFTALIQIFGHTGRSLEWKKRIVVVHSTTHE